MKTIAALTMFLLVANPLVGLASRDHRPVGRVLDTIPPRSRPERYQRADRQHPGQLPRRPGRSDPAARPPHPGKHHHRRPVYAWPAATTTVVREIQPIIIVAPPSSPAPAPPPEPKKEWVPPLMGTRIEAGYWDYGIRKVWMGDHWRFEQDMGQPKWVPERQVRVVKQEGYWKIVD